MQTKDSTTTPLPPAETHPLITALDEKSNEVEQLRSELKNLKRQHEKLLQIHSEGCGHDQGPHSDAQHEALHMAQLIIDHSPVILFRRLAGEEAKLVYVSDNIRQIGYLARELLDETISFKDLVHPDDEDRVGEEIEGHTDTNVDSYIQEYRILTRTGDVRWVEDRTSVIRDSQGAPLYNQGIVVDITERKLAEEALQKSEEKFRRIIESTGEGFLLMDCDLKIREANAAYCKMLGYKPDELVGKTPYDFASEGFRNYLGTHLDQLMATEYRKIEGQMQAKDGHEVPVLIHGNTLRRADGQKIGNIAFVTDLTEQKRALNLAGKVQRNLVPRKAPQIPGLEIAGRSESCQEVGGDYYDFLEPALPTDSKLRTVVGDISGHGVDAALFMTAARSLIRTRADDLLSPSEIVASMNRTLTVDMTDTGHFMTLFYMEIDPRRDRACWVRAGHDPALLFDPGRDAFEELLGMGLPLGIDDKMSYIEYAVDTFKPGSVIAIATDGIWEACNQNGEMFGKSRYRDLLRKHAHLPAAAILDRVFLAMQHFTDGAPLHDDATLVIIKHTPTTNTFNI